MQLKFFYGNNFRLLILFLFAASGLLAQESKTRNIIVVTLDGYRWKELYAGADERILANSQYVEDKQVIQLYSGQSDHEKREKLMPFFWNVIAKQGQLYGNRKYRNKVNCSNNHLLSYPGYSEMFVGHTDRAVSSNDNVENPNPTVFEFIHAHHAFNNKIAAFTTWGTFNYILREEKSGIYVNSGKDLAVGQLSSIERQTNESLEQSPKRKDNHTFNFAFEYLKRERPRVMFLGFDGTDDNAHGGRYDEYLKSANSIDGMLASLWSWVQSQPDYKNQTTLLITTDHGRGNGKNTWKNHRLLARGSRHIWFAVMGPDTPAFGELKFETKYYQKQVAQTIAAFLGLHYKAKQPTGEVVQTMISVPQPSGDVVFLGKTGTKSSYNNK